MTFPYRLVPSAAQIALVRLAKPDATAQVVDTCLEVWVAVEASDLPTLRGQVARFGTVPGQETMYFERTAAAVDFIPAQPPGRERP